MNRSGDIGKNESIHKCSQPGVFVSHSTPRLSHKIEFNNWNLPEWIPPLPFSSLPIFPKAFSQIETSMSILRIRNETIAIWPCNVLLPSFIFVNWSYKRAIKQMRPALLPCNHKIDQTELYFWAVAKQSSILKCTISLEVCWTSVFETPNFEFYQGCWNYFEKNWLKKDPSTSSQYKNSY